MKTLSQWKLVGLWAVVLCMSVTGYAAAPQILSIAMAGVTPQFTVQSDLVITNQIQFCTDLSQPNWQVLTNVLVAQTPYQITDASAPAATQRFYRVVAFLTKPPTPFGMALIPACSFTMGDTFGDGEAEGFPGEVPTHTVYVSSFYVDTNLVTYGLWQQVSQWALTNGYSFAGVPVGKANNHPVVNAKWYDAVVWCNARSEMDGLTPCYYTDASQTAVYRGGFQTNGSVISPLNIDLTSDDVNWNANGYRLPTEAEWEKAARGGAAGHRFPWTDVETIDWSRANYYSYWSGGQPGFPFDVNPIGGSDTNFTAGGQPYTSPVGSFAPNGYGLYDMAGNVLEWCWDWHDFAYYSSSPGTDPRGPSAGPQGNRVSRGGSWGGASTGARCAFRFPNTPISALSYLGFRCARGF